MSWRARLQPGFYQGVPFFTDSHEASGGRRLALHEYPLRDEPFAEDMGRRAREFTVECYVVASAVAAGGRRGDDYFDARDRLIEVFENGLVGTLAHPYLGTRKVAVKEYRLRESTREGGMANFTVIFVEAGRAAEPGAETDTGGEVDVMADAASLALQTDFAATFKVADLPEFVSTSATGIVNDVTSQLRTISGRIAGATKPITEFSASLDRLGSSLATLIQQPANLAKDLVGVFVALAGVGRDVKTALDGYRNLWPFGKTAAAVPTTTATRKQQAANQTALHALTQRAATVEACRAAAKVELQSFDAATRLREELADQLDALMETAADDVYAKLSSLRAAVIEDITARGANLARIVTYTPGQTLPALVIAYSLYENCTREAEIVARNHIRHPGFVPGGQPLEVLADAA